MKKLLTVLIATAGLTLSACGQKQPDRVYHTGRANAVGANNVSPNPSQNQGGWGQINADPAQVVNFVSSGLQSSQIQYSNQGCTTANGVQCQIDFNIGDPNNNFMPVQLVPGGNQYTVSESTLLTIAIYDALTGRTAPDGSIYTPIAAPIPLQNQSANIIYNGNTGCASLTFGSDLGQVTMSGGIVGTNWSNANQNGQCSSAFNFVNNVDVNTPGQGIQGNLGTFSINVCYVFQCN